MPPSQLKRLKASLREQGIVGPQKSKKQKKENAQSGANKDKRVNRNAALAGIREQFNPFEIKTNARGPKFEVTNARSVGGATGTKSVKNRPGVAKGLGEENRRQTLLVEMQRRNKVGGILDKRFGENDPSMAPEDKMLERFTQEIQRRHKNTSAFDLEDDNDSGLSLTHMGKSLSLNGAPIADDFEEDDLMLSDAEDHPSDDERQLKRRRGSDSEGSDEEDNGADKPERKKTKQEVMKEVIEKSKFHKYERQKNKDDDEDLREELDKEMSDIQSLLRGIRRPAAPTPDVMGGMGMNPARAAILNGQDKILFDKEYDKRLRQLAQDKKSKPTERTKPEEERLLDEARRLRELEIARLRRMEGEVDREEEPKNKKKEASTDDLDIFEEEEEVDEFGLGPGIKAKEKRPSNEEMGVEDEDDFIIDDDLVASSGSELDSDDESASENGEEDEPADDFLDGLLNADEARRPEFLTGANAPLPDKSLTVDNGVNGNLAYTFPCPETQEELVKITETIDIQDLPIVVRRIRALYNPQLKAENKGKLGKFVAVLVDHISYLANQPDFTAFAVLEQVIRHIHSLAKTQPVEAANTFRKHLADIQESRPLAPTPGDLVILTAIGTVFPTSDHFHQVVTPAMLTIGRFLGQKIPASLADYSMGTYLATLAISYQIFSKRYVPEVVGFLMNTLCAVAPAKMSKIPANFPYHEPKGDFRIDAPAAATRMLSLKDTINRDISDVEAEAVESALAITCLSLLDAAADTWNGKSSFLEIFRPAEKVVKHFTTKKCSGRLPKSLKVCLAELIPLFSFLFILARMSNYNSVLSHDCCCAEDVLTLSSPPNT